MSAQAVIGLAIMIVSEAATLAQVEPFWSWNTPICWTGFILFADGLVRRRRGHSWIGSSPREFAFLAIVSIPLWLVFEFYNLVIRNWYYVGLPRSMALRWFGYAWSFATISPALFEGAELVATLHGRLAPLPARLRSTLPPRSLSIAIGALMLIAPFVVSPTAAQYLAAPVWLGFILVLDPINDALGLQSISGDWRRGRVDRLVNLLLSGLLCGLLWEFWNFWSRSKWHYTIPFWSQVKLFEMPLPGFLGFPPFAVECFAMYVLVRALVARVLPVDRPAAAGSGAAEPAGGGRAVGL